MRVGIQPFGVVLGVGFFIYMETTEKIIPRHVIYYSSNKERIRANNAKWRAANKDKVKAHRDKWAKSNRHKVIERTKKWQEENPEKVKANKKRWYQKNLFELKKKRKIWIKENKQKSYEIKQRWAKNNPEKVKASRNNWLLKNPEYPSSLDKKRKLNDPIYAMKIRLRTRLSHIFKSTGFKKQSTTEKMLGCSFVKFKKHIESKFTEGMSWDNRSEWHLDHIIPLSCATTVEGLEKLSNYTNIRPMWAKENIAKSNNLILLP